MPSTTIEQQLATLHAHYTGQVNAAVAAGRMDLAQDLAVDCETEALDLILSLEGDTTNAAEVEILDVGGGLPQWPRGRPGRRRHRFWRRATDR
jgi:hypothetical protein